MLHSLLALHFPFFTQLELAPLNDKIHPDEHSPRQRVLKSTCRGSESKSLSGSVAQLAGVLSLVRAGARLFSSALFKLSSALILHTALMIFKGRDLSVVCYESHDPSDVAWVCVTFLCCRPDAALRLAALLVAINHTSVRLQTSNVMGHMCHMICM